MTCFDGVFHVREPAGMFRLFDGLTVICYSKPSWLRRTAMRLVFGWVWTDAKALGGEG